MQSIPRRKYTCRFPLSNNPIVLESFQTCSSQTIDPSESLSDETTRYQYSDTSVQQKTILPLLPDLHLMGLSLHLKVFIQ